MSRFDRFAARATALVAHAAFFAGCVLLVLLWAPSILLIRDLDLWQLIINTATTIITFLLVALLQNGQRQFEVAVYGKLDALADALKPLSEADSDQLAEVPGSEERTGANG